MAAITGLVLGLSQDGTSSQRQGDYLCLHTTSAPRTHEGVYLSSATLCRAIGRRTEGTAQVGRPLCLPGSGG